MRMAKETWLILLIGLADLGSTVYLVRRGLALEANPIMAWYLLNYGILVFGMAKLALLIAPLVILEWARKVKPVIGYMGLRIALVGYVIMYIGVVLQLNQPLIERKVTWQLAALKQRWNLRGSQDYPATAANLPMAISVATEL